MAAWLRSSSSGVSGESWAAALQGEGWAAALPAPMPRLDEGSLLATLHKAPAPGALPPRPHGAARCLAMALLAPPILSDHLPGISEQHSCRSEHSSHAVHRMEAGDFKSKQARALHALRRGAGTLQGGGSPERSLRHPVPPAAGPPRIPRRPFRLADAPGRQGGRQRQAAVGRAGGTPRAVRLLLARMCRCLRILFGPGWLLALSTRVPWSVLDAVMHPPAAAAPPRPHLRLAAAAAANPTAAAPPHSSGSPCMSFSPRARGRT